MLAKREQTLVQAGVQFDRMDPTGKGYVTRDDILELRRAQQCQMSTDFGEATVDKFMSEFDQTEKGWVTRQDFVAHFAAKFDSMIAK